MANKRRAVKRVYTSPLREDQARATRVAIIDAAARLFAADGYAAVSVDAIAAAAGVGRATVFTAVGGKPALIREAYASAFGRAAGALGEAMALVERPRSRVVRASKTVREYIEGYAGVACDISRHVAPIHEALREAARTDADVRKVLDDAHAYRRNGAKTIVADIAARAKLRAGDVTAIEDAVWAIIDPGWYHLLVGLRGWSDDTFRDWLVRTITAETLGT